MAAKKLVVELLGADGKGVSGVAVKLAGSAAELTSGAAGTVLFICEEPQVSISVAGQEVFSGPLDAAPERVVLVQDGGGWKRK